MVESKEFQLWLRRTLGQQAAVDAEAARLAEVQDQDVKIEVRVHGRWTQVQESDLRA
jgi:hypothetical protein